MRRRYPRHGHWVVCDICGHDRHASECQLTHDNLFTCRQCWYPPNPLDEPVVLPQDTLIENVRPETFSYLHKGMADDDDAICASQKPTIGGALTLNGVLYDAGLGYAEMDYARPVTITSDADDYDRQFRITGTSDGTTALIVDRPGPIGRTEYGIDKFKTVTEVKVDAATRGNIKVGVGNISDPVTL